MSTGRIFRLRRSGFAALLLLLATAVAAGVTVSSRAVSSESGPLRLDALTPKHNLTHGWRFQPGDDPGWASPEYDDSHWRYKPVPERWPEGGFPATGQMAWYRTTLYLDVGASGIPGAVPMLGVQTGQVMSAFELYAGGRLVGAVGELPPAPRIQYDRMRVFPIPPEAIGKDGGLVLALRVWGGPQPLIDAWYAGPYQGAFRIGHYTPLIQSLVLGELPGLIAVVLFLAFGLYLLYLYRRNRQLVSYFWFGMLAINIGIYSLCLAQWKYLLGWEFMTYQKVEYASIQIMPAVAMQLVWVVLQKPIGPLLRFYQLSFLAFALIGAAVPGLQFQYVTLEIWQLWVVPAMFYGCWILLQGARSGNREAGFLVPGVMVFCLSGLAEIVVHYLALQTVPLIPIGFAAIAVSMGLSLADSFTSMLNTLEVEVARRTADLSEANLQLAEVARADPLTGLLNRRGFIEEAETEVQRFQRSGRPFSIVLCDVDHFKRVNDTYGHACGDYVLRRVADIITDRLRDVDRAGRWGGEEFILLLPETETQGAAFLADKLRNIVAESSFQFEGESVGVTMTFGVASYRRTETLDGCIARADTAMYHGKKAGRNKVMLGGYKGLTLVN